MYIEQIYTNCLAEASYYIESESEAVIIDPIRETDPYLKKLSERKAKLKYVFETHFHADFVSGHIDLAGKTGAKIVFGPGAETGYSVHHGKDNEIFTVGKLRIKLLHTPGHTPESSSFLLYDESGKEHAIFTGDTLFVGDVGRPDLLDGKMSKEELAGMLYDSLNKKIKSLPDDVLLYPAHGPGSACGKSIGNETWSTIGIQKKQNYALQDMTKEEFISKVTEGLSEPPKYFFTDAGINKQGYTDLEGIMKRNLKALSVNEFKEEMKRGVAVLDSRMADSFEKGFIPGAVNIGLDGQFAVWVGTLFDAEAPLLVLAEEGKEEETVLRLARVGFENIKGYLEGGISSWIKAKEPVDRIQSLTAKEFAKSIGPQDIILDVRRQGEYGSGHVKGALNICLSKLQRQLSSLDKNKTYLVHCAGGYRSMIAASILRAQGFRNVRNVYGGFTTISQTGVPLEVSKDALC